MASPLDDPRIARGMATQFELRKQRLAAGDKPIGWKAGFRGPWCFEHFHETLDGLIEGLMWLRGRLEGWMAEGD